MQNKFCSEIKSHSRIDVRRAIKIFDSDVDTFSAVNFCLKFLLHTRFSASLFGARWQFLSNIDPHIHISNSPFALIYYDSREVCSAISTIFKCIFNTTTHWIRVKFRSLQVWQEIIYPSLSREQLFIKRYTDIIYTRIYLDLLLKINALIRGTYMQCIINILGVALIFKFNAYFIPLIQRVRNVHIIKILLRGLNIWLNARRNYSLSLLNSFLNITRRRWPSFFQG